MIRLVTTLLTLTAFIFLADAPGVAAQERSPIGKWQPLSPGNGQGTVVCNFNGKTYACFALRCGKHGRGTEFALLFNTGKYGTEPNATLVVDGQRMSERQFVMAIQNRELVSRFDAARDGGLIGALKAGSSFTVNLGVEHKFSLKSSSEEIDRALTVCGENIGGEALTSETLPQHDPANLSWRENDTEESYVARIRQAAVSYGGACDEEQALFERLQRDIKVDVSQTEIRAGELVTVNWSGNTLDKLIPAWLVVATDAPVRFQGEGFYALMPNAIGPFGIETFKDKTRAIVPLYGKGARKAGKIEIEGILAGRIRLETSVVGWQRKCQVETAEVASLGEVKVKPAGAPVIDLDDRLAVKQADKYLVNAGRTRLIDERGDGTWQLLDSATLSPILKGTGTEPRFSETGRFLAVPSKTYLIVYDVMDGKELYRSEFGSITWDNKDSFAGFTRLPFGEFEAFNTLAPENSLSGGGSARGPSQDIPTHDLENNLGVISEGSEPFAFRIGSPGIKYSISDKSWAQEGFEFNMQDLSRGLITHFAGAYVNVHSKRHRKTHGSDGWQKGIKHENCKSSCKKVILELLKKYVEPRRVAPQTVEAEKTAGAHVSLVAARTLLSIDKVTGETPSTELLESFGIRTLAANAPLFRGDVGENAVWGYRGPNAGQVRFGAEIRQKILADIPQSAKFFKGFDKFKDDHNLQYVSYGGDFAVDYAYRYKLAGRYVWLTQVIIKTGQSGANYISYMKLFFDGMKADRLDSRLPDTDEEFDNEGTDTDTDCFGSLSYCKANVVAYDDRYLVIWSADARGLVVFNGETGQFVLKKFDLPRGDLIHDISLTDDKNHLLQQNSDGTFYVHRIADAATVLEGRIVDDEVIVWTQDLRFDSSAEGAHFVNLKFPGQIGQYTFQQFDSRLRVPGLVQQVLSGQYKPQPLEVGVPPRLAGSLEGKNDRIVGSVTPESLGDLRSIRVYQDGVLSDEIPVAAGGETVAIEVARLSGARWVSLVAVDQQGLVSLPVGRDLGADARPAALRLLAVGVDNYDNAAIPDLSLARADANTLAESIGAADGKTVALAQSTVLKDGEALPEAVLAAAEKLVAEAQPGEQAVFFFAGHGVKGEDGRFYMATSNTDPKNISGTALSWDRLSQVLAKSKARMTVFIDACHSGAAGTDFFATNDDAAAGILKNIPSGLTVFSASKGRELSQEDPALGGGQFTQAVASVIGTERDRHDLNGNGVIEVSELYVGVKRLVVERTKGKQTPWLARNQMVGDFTLF